MWDNSPFSPFAVVPLFEVTGLAETFPSFSVSGPFLLDFPGFQVPSDSIVPPQLWSSSRSAPPPSSFLQLLGCFSVSPILLTCPNNSSLLLLITVAIASTFVLPTSPHFAGVLTGSPSLPIAPFSSLLLPYAFHLCLTLTMFRIRKAKSV